MRYSKQFDSKVRDSGVGFYFINESSGPLYDFIRSVHKDSFGLMLPNDWIYNTIHSAFLDLEDLQSDDELDDIIFHLEADVYTNGLLGWLYYNSFANAEVNEVVSSGDYYSCFEDMVARAQLNCMERVYRQTWEFIKSQREESENE